MAAGAISSSDPTLASAGEQLELMERGVIGTVELLDLHLARVRAVNPTVNAVVALDEEGARRTARAADAARAAGRSLGPLHGLPMTVKDTYEVVGMPATCGIVALKDHRPTEDADLVQSLRAAGAVIFGKTNTPEGAGDHQTYNAVYGVTRNPWDLGRSAGGSSGGAAVALATGMAPLDIGSDIGGSIRCPAHFNGVFGLKPSFGIVPMRGHIPPPPGTLTAPEMGVGGPLARSAADLERALDVVARPGALDRKGKVWRLPAPRRERFADFRVALWADDRDYPVEPAYLDAIAAFAGDLRREGVSVTEARPAIDPAESHAIYTAMLFGAWGTGLDDEAFAAYVEESRGLDPADQSWAARVGRAPAQSLRDWLILLERRERMRWAWEAFFRDYDLLLCPVMTTVAFPHDHSGVDHTAQLKRTIKVGSGTRPYLDNLIWPGLITVVNLPSVAFPMPHRVGRLPAGIQMVSGFLEDRTALAFARLAEERFGGYRVPDLGSLAA